MSYSNGIALSGREHCMLQVIPYRHYATVRTLKPKNVFLNKLTIIYALAHTMLEHSYQLVHWKTSRLKWPDY